MWRLLVYLMMVVLLPAAGCGSARGRAVASAGGGPGARQASEYIEGFMDGYNSAFPERGHSKDSRAYQRPSPHRHGRRSAYRDGWDSGHRTGANDERQRQ